MKTRDEEFDELFSSDLTDNLKVSDQFQLPLQQTERETLQENRHLR